MELAVLALVVTSTSMAKMGGHPSAGLLTMAGAQEELVAALISVAAALLEEIPLAQVQLDTLMVAVAVAVVPQVLLVVQEPLAS